MEDLAEELKTEVNFEKFRWWEFFYIFERTVIIMLSSLLILGLAVKTVKDHYYIGMENLTLIGTNDKVVDFYA